MWNISHLTAIVIGMSHYSLREYSYRHLHEFVRTQNSYETIHMYHIIDSHVTNNTISQIQ